MVVPSTVWVTKRGSRHHCPNIAVLPPGGRYCLTPFAQVHQPQCSPKRYKVLTRNGLKGISLHKQGNRSRMAGIAIQRLYLMSFCVKQQKCVISRHSKMVHPRHPLRKARCQERQASPSKETQNRLGSSSTSFLK